MRVRHFAANMLEVKQYSSIYEWANKHRYLRDGASEKGAYDINNVIYLKDVYDSLLNYDYEFTALATPAQAGKTECGFNFIGYSLDVDPLPAFFCLPTKDACKLVSKKRLTPFFEQTKTLCNKMTENSTLDKTVNGVMFKMPWGTSASQLCSDPFARGVVDEYDRQPDDVQGEGSLAELLLARTTTYQKVKIFLISTPLVLGESKIWSDLEKGTFKRFHIPCPKCKTFFCPSEKTLNFEENKDFVFCPYCMYIFEEDNLYKYAMLGKYVGWGQTIDKGGNVKGDLKETNIDSFWFSGLITKWASIKKICVSLRDAIRKKDPKRIKSIKNLKLGEPYSNKVEKPKVEVVRELGSNFERGVFYESFTSLIMTVDVQKDCFFYVLRQWKKDETSYQVDYGRIDGDTEGNEIWQKLRDLVTGGVKTNNGRIKEIDVCGIDARWRSHKVYAFCKSLPDYCIPIRGFDEQDTPIQKRRADMIFKGERFVDETWKYNIDEGYFKEMLYSLINNKKKWFLSNNFDNDYCKQVVSEDKVLDEKKNKYVWKENGANHFLDCEKMNLACASIMRVDLIGSNELSHNDSKIISLNRG